MGAAAPAGRADLAAQTPPPTRATHDPRRPVLRAAHRLLPREWPPWSAVFYRFRKWRRDGTWERVHTLLRRREQVRRGRDPEPSAGSIDSQSVKMTERGMSRQPLAIGCDGGKNAKGRKRHLLVDTQGFVLWALVHPADLQDRAGAPQLLLPLAAALPRLELIWADSANLGPLQTWVQQTFGWRLAIVERPGGCGWWLPAGQEPPARLPGFQLLPRRWIVERTIAWIRRNRRMSKDYEFLPATSEAWVYLSMLRVMLKLLAHEQIQPGFHYRLVA